MKARFSFIDPGSIMAAVVALVILAVGIYAFFITMQSISSTINDVNNSEVQKSLTSINDTGLEVFNILGIVMIIGAIMAVVGVIYQFVGVGGSSSSSSSRKSRRTKLPSHYSVPSSYSSHISSSSSLSTPTKQKCPSQIGDYNLIGTGPIDYALEKAKEYREQGYWAKIRKIEKSTSSFTDDKQCGIYISKWKKEDEEIHGKPKFS